MAILLKRARLRLLWLVTRHPRFRPLYFADVVSYDQIEQAAFLCHAGFYAAATMVARNALESRVKRLALITPQWTRLTARDRTPVHELANFLAKHTHIRNSLRNRICAQFDQASRVCHGNEFDPIRASEIIEQIRESVQSLDQVAASLLAAKGRRATTSGTHSPLQKGGQLCNV